MSYNNIPKELIEKPQWVSWGIQDFPQKAPFNPVSLLSGRPTAAKAGIPETWSCFDDAVRCVERGLATGIGYEFAGDDFLFGVDLDHVIDENGVSPQVREIVSELASYTEISPSGTGLHIFVTAQNADISRHRKKDGFVEIYSTARYFTVTGNTYGTERYINERSAQLQRIHDIYLLPEPGVERKPLPFTTESVVSVGRFLTLGLERDSVFAALWGGVRRIGNESSDDQALMNKLAYWCNADPGAMVSAFLQSPHHEGKDDKHKKKCQRLDYLLGTAKNACATVYSTAAADYERYQHNRKSNRKRSNTR
ncbi:hypothetical protein LJC01_00680 [Clostridiaceae bacterium OttesenSCG-928-D20]|nr:hypothetical protein [Clostridiaceae bacterium OttesenSCG-928-D20]